jgi:glycosyltransferase involved in cell wall biosynthesis
MRACKLLFVEHFAEPGGAQLSLLGHLRALDRTRYEPSVLFSTEGRMIERVAALGVRTARMPLSPYSKRQLPAFLLSTIRLLGFLRRHRVDLLHANSIRATLDALWAARLARVPIVAHIRDVREFRPVIESQLLRSDRVIAISRAVHAAFRDHRERISIIPNGIDLETVRVSDADREAFRRQWKIPPGAPVIGMASRLNPEKGHLCFLEAAARILRERPETFFLIVGQPLFEGEDEYERGLRQRVADSEVLRQRVVFTGYLDRVEIALAAMDVLVLASRSEGFGRVLIEGMAQGKPVVASRAGGPEDIIVEDETGLFFPPDDGEALAASLLRLLGSPELSRRLGEQGRRRAGALFDVRKTTRRVEEVYQQLMAGRQR